MLFRHSPVISLEIRPPCDIFILKNWLSDCFASQLLAKLTLCYSWLLLPDADFSVLLPILMLA